MSAKVSVIIPAFNRAHMLRELVDSALTQHHADVELILVDDGSTDGTRELVADRYGADARVRYLYQAKAGAATARNAGLDLATGEYVAFLDSDDSWKPWHLSLMLAGLERYPQAGIIWTDTDFVDAAGVTRSTSALRTLFSAYRFFSLDDLFPGSSPLSDLGIDIPPEYHGRRLHVGDVYSPMIMGNLILTSSVVMSRERLEHVGRFDEQLIVGEDYEFYLRACRAGPVAFANIADVRYRIGTPDKLGGPDMALAMAQSYLRVLDSAISRDGERITLPPGMIAVARIHAHRWVGELQLLAGSRRLARAHFAQALRIRPRQPSVVVMLVLTLLPSDAVTWIVRWRRRVRGWFRRLT